MLKSDLRVFSYENIKQESGLEPNYNKNEKSQKLAASFQFSLSVASNMIFKVFLDLARSRFF